MNGYLGVDVGSISTKGVIINDANQILAAVYLWTAGDPIKAVKAVITQLELKVSNEVIIRGVGVTGSARKLIGTILGANIIKNEITAHAMGTLAVEPDVRTILEIGGQDSKIIILENGVIMDYAMNTLCAAGTGSFLSSQAKRLGVRIEDFGALALTSTNPTKIAARCTVFAESDLIHKAQIGYQQKDIIAGLCMAVVSNYLNNVGKGKKIKTPIVFQGGVSKNEGVVKAFAETLKEKVIVYNDGHLAGALGVAILSKKEPRLEPFSFNLKEINFKTRGYTCKKCPNQCDIICVYKEQTLLDAWGNRCEQGLNELYKKEGSGFQGNDGASHQTLSNI